MAAPGPRGPYMKISSETRERLIQAHENGENMHTVCRILNVKARTAASILRQYELDGRREALPRGGRRVASCKVDDDIRLVLQQIIDENPLATLQMMQEQLGERLPHKPRIGLTTISDTLQGMLITVKSVTKGSDLPDVKYSEDNRAKRRDFALEFVNLPIDSVTVYVDEAGFNLWTRRSRGRAERGQPIRRLVHTQKGLSTNVCLAISPALGLVHHHIFQGGQTKVRFEVFLQELVALLRDRMAVDESAVIIFDGPSFHRNMALPPDDGGRFRFWTLPPYSPELNAAELAHSTHKAAIKRELSRPEVIEELRVAPDGLNLLQWRSTVMHRICLQNLEAITHQKCLNWHAHTIGQMNLCLNVQ